MSESFRTMVQKPSAFLPIAMSLMALVLLGGAYIYGRATGRVLSCVNLTRVQSLIYGSF